MIKVGLTGTRFSGKDSAIAYFRKIGIPIFDADVVIKFILNYNYEIVEEIKKLHGIQLFDDDMSLSINKLSQNGKFNDILSHIEEDLFFAYDNFNKKNKNSIYSVFSCSVLFEQKWDKKMDHNISIYAPFMERIERAKRVFNSKNITKITTLLAKETSELEKNKLADYVVHSYGDNNVFVQIHKIDQGIIDEYLYNSTYDNYNMVGEDW